MRKSSSVIKAGNALEQLLASDAKNFEERKNLADSQEIGTKVKIIKEDTVENN